MKALFANALMSFNYYINKHSETDLSLSSEDNYQKAE